MSAVVVPVLKVEHRTRPSGAWLVGCFECNWFPDRYFDEEIAMQDGLDHNRVRHDGAGVECRPDIALEHAVVHERFLARTLRMNRIMAYGVVVAYSLLIALLWSPWGSGLFALYGVILYRQSSSVGKWWQRLNDHHAEVADMRLLASEADDGAES